MKQIYKFFQKYKEMNIFFLFQIMIFSLLFISLLMKDSGILTGIYLLVLICSIVSCYSIYRIYKNVNSHIALEVEAALIQKQQQIQREHLKITKENRVHLEELRDSIHEELSLESEAIHDSLQARNKAQHLIDKYAGLYRIDYCTNKIIDAILYNKFQVAQSLHIRCNANIILPETLAIKDIDLMFLFTNLLDNAIEACEKLLDKQRFIDMEASIKANFLVVCVRNAKDETFKINPKNMVSTKEDSEHHGLGLQIIKRVCKQYKGSLKIEDHGSFVDIYTTLALTER